MKLLELALAALAQKIRRHLHPGEEELIRIASIYRTTGHVPDLIEIMESQWEISRHGCFRTPPEVYDDRT